jgi:hypothetical protein
MIKLELMIPKNLHENLKTWHKWVDLFSNADANTVCPKCKGKTLTCGCFQNEACALLVRLSMRITKTIELENLSLQHQGILLSVLLSGQVETAQAVVTKSRELLEVYGDVIEMSDTEICQWLIEWQRKHPQTRTILNEGYKNA